MEKKPIAWVDSPVYSKERKVLTGQTLQVPGLRMYGHHNTAHAISPLDTHYHRDCFEFTYLVHGNVRFSVDGRTYPLSGGDLFVTMPNEVHDTAGIPMSVHQLYWFQLEARDPDNFLFMAPGSFWTSSPGSPPGSSSWRRGRPRSCWPRCFRRFTRGTPSAESRGSIC